MLINKICQKDSLMLVNYVLKSLITILSIIITFRHIWAIKFKNTSWKVGYHHAILLLICKMFCLVRNLLRWDLIKGSQCPWMSSVICCCKCNGTMLRASKSMVSLKTLNTILNNTRSDKFSIVWNWTRMFPSSLATRLICNRRWISMLLKAVWLKRTLILCL